MLHPRSFSFLLLLSTQSSSSPPQIGAMPAKGQSPPLPPSPLPTLSSLYSCLFHLNSVTQMVPSSIPPIQKILMAK